MIEEPQKHPEQEQTKDADDQCKPEAPLWRLHTIVRLEDEATECGADLPKIFAAASNGELEILFKRPDLSPRLILRPQKRNELVSGIPMTVRTPDYLVLRTEDCMQLHERRSALIEYSVAGYRAGSHQTNLTKLLASEADKDPLYYVEVEGKKHTSPDSKYGFWGRWELWSDSFPVQYPVRPEDVFVRKEEFKRWRLEVHYPKRKKVPKFEGNTNLPSPEHSMLPIEKRPEEYRSGQLRWACDAAHHWWAADTVVFDNPKTWPLDEEIMTWLMDNAPAYFPKKTPALHAVSLMRPEFARRSPSSD